MQFSSVLFVGLTFLFVVLCQPQTCHIPSAWSATLSQAIRLNQGKDLDTNYGQIYFSAPQQKIRVDIASGKIRFGDSGFSSTYSETVWQDFKNNIQYVLNRVTGSCSSSTLLLPMMDQLPADTEFLGSTLIGSQLIHEYGYSKTYQGSTYDVEIGLLAGICLPLNVEIFNSTASAKALYVSESFVNSIPMVPAFILDIPQECLSSSSATHREMELHNKAADLLHFLSLE